MRDDLDLAIADLVNLDRVAEVASAAIDLDAVVEELFKGGDVEDLVVGGLRGVDDELERADQHHSMDQENKEELTFFVTFWPFFPPLTPPAPCGRFCWRG